MAGQVPTRQVAGVSFNAAHYRLQLNGGGGLGPADALALAEEIRERVKREQGIDLEYEIELWSSK